MRRAYLCRRVIPWIHVEKHQQALRHGWRKCIHMVTRYQMAVRAAVLGSKDAGCSQTLYCRTPASSGSRSKVRFIRPVVANKFSRARPLATARRERISASASSIGNKSWRVAGGVALSRYSKAVPLSWGSSVWSARKAMRTAPSGSRRASKVKRCSRLRSARSRSLSSKNHCVSCESR